MFTRKTKLKMGVAHQVANTNSKPNSASIYIAIKVEDVDGSNERKLLLTEYDLYSHSDYKCPNLAGKLKQGRCYPMTACGEKQQMFLLKIKRADNIYDKTLYTVVIRVSQGWLEKGKARAAKNKNDLPEQGFWSNLFD